MNAYENFASEKDIYLNNESLVAQGNIKITSYAMSPLKARTNTIEVPGINGVLDISYSLFDYMRYEEWEFKIDFVIFEETKDMAMEVIKRINEIVLKQKVQFAFAKDSAFYTEGRVENSVEYEQEFNGLYYCSLTLYCYPYATKHYKDDMLWDDIYFPTDYFNTLDYVLNGQESKSINVYVPKNFSNTLEIYSTMSNGVFTDVKNNMQTSIMLGHNKVVLIPTLGGEGLRVFNIKNSSNVSGVVKISFKTEVLEYV